MGTPAFAVPSLKALIKNHEVVAVCTQPDRPAGRGNKLTPSPIKEVALSYNIPVLQPHTLRLDESREIRTQLKSYNADLFVVAAYGIILPKGVLRMPSLACINVHASLLPKYRGASPIHASLLNGDTSTGITIMHMDVGIDTGDMILQRTLDISPTERFSELHDRMADLGGETLLEAITMLKNGTAPRLPQDDALSCHAPMLKKTDGLIDWSKSTKQIQNLIRALELWPNAYTTFNGQVTKIWGIKNVVEDGDLKGLESTPAGTILYADSNKGLLIKTGDGVARIMELQAVGGKRMSTADYLRGRKIEV